MASENLKAINDKQLAELTKAMVAELNALLLEGAKRGLRVSVGVTFHDVPDKPGEQAPAIEARMAFVL